MKNRSALFILPIFSILLVACKGAESLTLEERLHNAYLDSIEAKEENIRPLVNLTKEDKNVSWKDDKALLQEKSKAFAVEISFAPKSKV